jgi:hypothetical protein
MRTYLAFVFGAALTFCIAPSFGARPQPAGEDRRAAADRVCLYKDADYHGWEQCYGVGDEIRNLGGKKNEISSIRVFGRARVIVYDKTDFQGRMTDFVSNVSNLGMEGASGGLTWNDRIESLRVNLDFGSGS